MRSDFVSYAMTQVSDRSLVARILAKATRRFHIPGARIQDTTNVALARFGFANPRPTALLSCFELGSLATQSNAQAGKEYMEEICSEQSA